MAVDLGPLLWKSDLQALKHLWLRIWAVGQRQDGTVLCARNALFTNFDTRLCELHTYVSHYLPRGRSHFLKYLTVFTEPISLKPCSIFRMPFSAVVYKHSFKFLPSDPINLYSNDKIWGNNPLELLSILKLLLFWSRT